MKFFKRAFFWLLLLHACQAERPLELADHPETSTPVLATQSTDISLSPVFIPVPQSTFAPVLPTTTPVSPTTMPFLQPTATALTPRAPRPTPDPESWGNWVQWDCVDSDSYDPCQRPIFDIDMLSRNEGWIVGGGGAIFYWDGNEWREQDSPTTATLQIVKALNPQNVWAAGYRSVEDDMYGVFIHWDGNAWENFPISETFTWITDISFVDENNGWAVVEERVGDYVETYLMHWDGVTWTKNTQAKRIKTVYMISANEGWAAGGGILHRWDGQSWEIVDESILGEEAANFGQSAHMVFTSQNDGWLVGDRGTTIRWDGSQWNSYGQLPISNVRDTALLEQQSWLLGFGNDMIYLLHEDGENWSFIDTPSPEPRGRFEGLAVLSEDDIWVVGHNSTYKYPYIWHWDGSVWVPFHVAPSILPINAFALTDENEAWSVGDGGYMSHWDGQQWNEYSGPTTNDLHDVDFISPDNGWAVGKHATMLHWDGKNWSLIKESNDSIYKTLELQDIAIISSTEVWAAGGVNTESGLGPLLIHLQWDGQTWQELEPHTPYYRCYFTAIAMLSANEGWAVGGGEGAGTIYWDGATWQIVSNPSKDDHGVWLRSVIALSSDAVWARGPSAGMIYWDGAKWIEDGAMLTPNPLPPMPTSEEWLKGKWNIAGYFWNGEAWISIRNSTTHRIINADVTPSGKIMALTDVGIWLRLEE